ncbi:trypsin-like peptidase domain-containing protein [Candidatus Peregrinibacteria bacterium]|nr:trypsin-like peptidase domain-containing protein [Candidatus Peregrinibacteria bacterium]
MIENSSESRSSRNITIFIKGVLLGGVIIFIGLALIGIFFGDKPQEEEKKVLLLMDRLEKLEAREKRLVELPSEKTGEEAGRTSIATPKEENIQRETGGGETAVLSPKDKESLVLKDEKNVKKQEQIWKDPEKERLIHIREKVIPSIVQLQCYGEGDSIQIGTGFYTGKEEGKYLVETNSHVVLADDGVFYGCDVYFPAKNGLFYETAYWAGFAYLQHDQSSIVEETPVSGVDYAVLELTKPYSDKDNTEYPFPPNVQDFFTSIGENCNNEGSIELGDKVYVLGYPAIGGESLTLTEGVVSGFLGEFGEWIKVSAEINPGNSGGVAISAEDECMFGIPTQVVSSETYGSIGQLLSYNFIIEFLNGRTGEKAFDPKRDVEDMSFESYPNQAYDLTFTYPSAWEKDFSKETSGTLEFIAPLQNALDDFYEGIEFFTEDLSGTEIVSLQDLEDALIDINSKNLSLVNDTVSEDRTMGGNPAKSLTYETNTTKIRQIFTMKNGRTYVFTYTAQTPSFDTYLPILEKMVSSTIIAKQGG